MLIQLLLFIIKNNIKKKKTTLFRNDYLNLLHVHDLYRHVLYHHHDLHVLHDLRENRIHRCYHVLM